MNRTRTYTVVVYGGAAHWFRNCPIVELEESFPTESDAWDYINFIKKYQPDYYFEIVYD